MKKITASILTVMLTLSMVFSSSVFAAEKTSAWDSFVGLFSNDTATTDATAVGVQYKGHVQNIGDVDWVVGPEVLGTEGQSLRLEAFYIELTDAPADMHIMYRVQVQNIGWMDWAEDGAIGGTTGQGLQVETVEIKLVDDNGDAYPGYSVQYRGHIQNKGDMPADGSWYADGEQLGTVGEFLRLEALEVQIVKEAADMTEYDAAVATANGLTEADYTTASWAALQTALTDNVVTEDNTQDEVDAATAAITAATDALVMVPRVVSTVAVNANQVQVTFNSAIKTESIISNTTTGALVAGNFTIGRSPLATVDVNQNVTAFAYGFLSDDGKVLTLTATSPTYFEGTYTITVADSVITTAGESVTAYAGTFTAEDTVAPTVTGLSYNTITGNIEATISEPITAAPTIVRVNGVPVSGSSLVTPDGTTVTIPKPASVAAGSTATVYLAGAADYAGNTLVGSTGSVVITTDATALAVTSMTQDNSNKIKVVFNKSIASPALTVQGATTVLVNGVSTAATVALDATDTENKTFIITVPGASAAPIYFYGTDTTKTLQVTFAGSVITDVFGQKLATTTNTVTMTKDTTGPVALSSKLSDDNKSIEVTYDEDLGTVVAGNIILRKDGVALSAVASATIKAGTGNEMIAVITPNAADVNADGTLVAGTYTIRLNASAATDVNTNASLAQNLTLVVSGTTSEAPIATITDGAANEFIVTYTAADGTTVEPVTAASALNAANYTLDGAALPAGTDMYFDGTLTTSKVHIVLPEGSVNIGVVGTGTGASLSVSGVLTTAGQTVATKTSTVTIEDNTSAMIESVSVLGNSILVTFNEDLSGGLNATVLNDFAIQVDGVDYVLNSDTLASTIVSGQIDTVQISITPGAGTMWDATKTIGVKYIGTGLKDANLFTVAAGTTYTTN